MFRRLYLLNSSEYSVFNIIRTWLWNIVSQPQNVVIIILLCIIILMCKNKILHLYFYIIFFLRQRIKNRGIKNFLLGLAKIFASPLFTVIITIIFPYLIDCYNSQINIIVLLWMFGVIINMLCNEYINGKNKLYKFFSSSLSRTKNVHQYTAEKIFTTRKNLPNIINFIVEKKRVGKEIEEYYFRFESAARIACETMYNIIKDVTGYTEHQVTVYKRFQDRQGKSCPKRCPLKDECSTFNQKKEWTKMIACHNKYGSLSTSFNQEHCFEYYQAIKDDSNNEQRKKHFYIHFFSRNKTEIEVLTGKKNIQEKFLFHESTKSREEKICQYIGIPLFYVEEDFEGQLCADINNDTRKQQHVTYSIIQIDFQDQGVIGKTEEDIKDFIENVFNGIISYLETSLQVEEMTKSFLSYVSLLSKLKEESSAEQFKEYNKLVEDYNQNVSDYNKLLNKHTELYEKYNKLLAESTEKVTKNRLANDLDSNN